MGIQTNLPVSVLLCPRLVGHWNAGTTLVRRARDANHYRAATAGYNLGQSLVLLATPRVNLLVETYYTRFESLVLPGQVAWDSALYVSPGTRWSHNFKSGLQIVPGVAVPFGVAPSGGERGLFLYLSFEHPFTRSHRN